MLSPIRTYIKISISLVLLGLILTYAYFQSSDFLHSPSVFITEPSNKAVFDESLVLISGTAKKVSRLSLNGRQIFTDEAGVFKEQLLLSPGYNIITLVAKDRFDRDSIEVLELVYKEKDDENI